MNTPLVLYVDDERANRVVFEQAFKARFQVRCVASGDEALAVLKEEPVAVLITDQRMPGMSGNELLQKARALYPDVTRVVLTAYSDLDPILRAVNDGLVARYMVKPWDRAELEQIIAWAMEANALARRDSALQLRLMETERLVTIGSIGAAVLHDLSQPIATMRLNLDRMNQHATLLQRTGAAGARSQEDQRAVETALGEIPELVEDLGLATDVMQGIVGQLRAFLRPGQPAQSDETGATPAGTEPVPIIRYASSVCRQSAARVLGQIIYDGAAKLPRVRIGATELTQVLINLIANAANAIGQGGRVIVSATADENAVRFVVADNGAGMTPEVLRKAGTPFFSTRAQGTGLGLSQCHRLLGAAGSRLEIASTVGQGTTVRFALAIA